MVIDFGLFVPQHLSISLSVFEELIHFLLFYLVLLNNYFWDLDLLRVQPYLHLSVYISFK